MKQRVEGVSMTYTIYAIAFDFFSLSLRSEKTLNHKHQSIHSGNVLDKVNFTAFLTSFCKSPRRSAALHLFPSPVQPIQLKTYTSL